MTISNKAVFPHSGEKSATKRPRTPAATEHQEQVALIRWFDLQFPALRGRLAAVPNASKCPPWVGKRMNDEGRRKGYPDLQLLTPRGGYHGLVIEMKKVKGGTLEPEQKDWLAWFESQGYRVAVCKGFEEAKAVIEGYLVFRASGAAA